MKYLKLGSSDLSVSAVCLGTMTWGSQNNQSEADQQIEYALSQGVNFIDTAEMYPVPPSGDTVYSTEKIIGHWLARNAGRRQEIVLASKVAGDGLPHIRAGGPITGEAILSAIDGSLERLQTGYLDLYQLHWPNRPSPRFGRHHPGDIGLGDTDSSVHSAEMLEILQALDECIKAGKVRHVGISNETPWGASEYIRLSEQHGLPRPVSIQNEFNLLHSMDWPHLLETCVHQDIAYLAWSPLAGGCLTGKYLNGARPEGSRWTLHQRNGLFRDTETSNQAIGVYLDVAKKHSLTPAQLALGWITQVEGVTSTIVGATSVEQLKDNISAFEKPLTDEAVADINAVQRRYPMPF